MISMQKGDYPKLQISKVDLPFTDADVGKRFEFCGTVLLDNSPLAEGPTFNFEVLELEFPEKEQGTMKSRKDKRMKTAGNVTINIQR
jgi:hypothetical protein